MFQAGRKHNLHYNNQDKHIFALAGLDGSELGTAQPQLVSFYCSFWFYLINLYTKFQLPTLVGTGQKVNIVGGGLVFIFNLGQI